MNSKPATGLQLRYGELPEAQQDLGDEEVRVCATDFETIAGYPAEKHRFASPADLVSRARTSAKPTPSSSPPGKKSVPGNPTNPSVSSTWS